MDPKPLEKQKRSRDQSRIEVSEGGSFTLRRLKEKSDAKKAKIAEDNAIKEAQSAGN